MISVSSGSKIGNGVNSFLLVELLCRLLLHVIDRVEFGAGSGALRLAPLVVRSGKESLETSHSTTKNVDRLQDFICHCTQQVA